MHRLGLYPASLATYDREVNGHRWLVLVCHSCGHEEPFTHSAGCPCRE